MKKALSLVSIAIAMSIVSCGPSAEEKAIMEAEDAIQRDASMEAAGAIMEAVEEADPAPEAVDSAATEEAEAPAEATEEAEAAH